MATGHFMSKLRAMLNRPKDSNTNQQVVADQSQSAPIIQCPTSMALLFVLTLETVSVCIMESFILYYHSKIFAACPFSLNTMGLGQADFIYHGLYMAAPVYQLSLYLDTLRQRNVFQLFTLMLFGEFLFKYMITLHFDIYQCFT